jgi:hypothetical protein
MHLPSPALRKPLHTRVVSFNGFEREDGLWDIDANLRDSRHYPTLAVEKGVVAAGDAVHDMYVRVTVDDDLVIRAIAASMASVPFGECPAALDPLQALVGCTLGPGWHKVLSDTLGGVKSCTHIRELLFNLATAAYQTIPVRRAVVRFGGPNTLAPGAGPSFHMGKCKSWDFNGAVIARHYPQFVDWKKDFERSE